MVSAVALAAVALAAASIPAALVLLRLRASDGLTRATRDEVLDAIGALRGEVAAVGAAVGAPRPPPRELPAGRPALLFAGLGLGRRRRRMVR